MGAKNRFNGLFEQKTQKTPSAQKSSQEKSEIEIIRRQIQKTIKSNPDMAKKAAMIIERMLEKSKGK